MIVKQDEHGDCMFIVLHGKVRVIHRKDGKQFELATLNGGDFFGELALVDEGPRWRTWRLWKTARCCASRRA